MAGVDMVLHGREQRAYTRKEQEEARKKRYEEEMSVIISIIMFDLFICCYQFVAVANFVERSDEDDNLDIPNFETMDDESETANLGAEKSVAKRGRTNFITDGYLQRWTWPKYLVVWPYIY